MSKKRKKQKLSEMVVLKKLPPGFLDDLPKEDQVAISAVVGKAIVLKGYDKDGRVELEFTEKNGTIHFIYVSPEFVSRVE
jgi:hypothetical protein